MTLAEVEPGRRVKVHAWATVEGPFPDVSAMAHRLQEALETGGFTARRAYAAIPIGAEHRNLSLPPLSGRELQRIIEREVRREGAIPPADRVFGYTVLRETTEQGGVRKKEVLLTIASEREIERYLRAVEEAGLTPWLVTSIPLALMAALELMDGVREPVVVAHLQGTTLQILVAEEGVLHFSREITVPTIPGGEGKESWEIVTTEINRSFMYFRQRFHRREIRRVLLSGNSVDLQGLQEALAQDQTLQVNVFDPGEQVELLAPQREGLTWRAALPGLAVPLGLASRRPEVQVNLIPKRVQARRWASVRRVAFASATLATLLLATAGYFGLFLGERHLRGVLEAQKKTWGQLEQQLKVVEEAERQRNLHQARLHLLEGWPAGGPLWAGIFREMSLNVPNDLLLHTMKVEADAGRYRMHLGGQVISTSPYDAQLAFNRFYEALRSSPFVASVELLQPLKVSRVLQEGEATGQVISPTGAIKAGALPLGGSYRLDFSLLIIPNGERKG
jgi:Tfp pilus assembly PilM family ATPase